MRSDRLFESSMLARLRSYLPTAILAFLIFYFGFQALTGDRGLLSINQRRETLESKTAELAQLQAEREELQVRARFCAMTAFRPTFWTNARDPS